MKKSLLIVIFSLLVGIKLVEAAQSSGGLDPKSFNGTFVSGAENSVPNYSPNHPTYDTSNLEETASVEANKNDSALLAKDIYRKQDFKVYGHEPVFNGIKDAFKSQDSIKVEYQDCKDANPTQRTCSEYLIPIKQNCEVGVKNNNDIQVFSCLKEKQPENKACQKDLNLTCKNYSYDFPKIISNTFSGYNYNFPNLSLGVSWMGQNCGGRTFEFKFYIYDPASVESFILKSMSWDDRINVSINDNVVYNYPTGGCEYGRVWSASPNINLKPYLKAGENKIKVILVIGGMGFFDSQIELKYKKCQEFTQNWVDGCSTYSGDKRCQFKEKTCLDKQTKILQEKEINQECFKYEEKYSCIPEDFNFNACTIFKEDSTCSQLTTKCLNYIDDECYKFENRYECSQKKELTNYSGITYENSSNNPAQIIDDSNCRKYASDQACILNSQNCLLKNSQNQCQKFSREYICGLSDNSECKILDKNCTLNSLTCSKKDEKNQCLINDKIYSCPNSFDQSIGQSQLLICGSQFYSKDNQTTAENDFGKAATNLMMLSEASKDFDANNLRIFNGSGGFCAKSVLGFSDCCKDSGWGQDAGLASCSTSEQNLAAMKSNKQCIYVGSFCSEKEKLTGTCLKNSKSYCCFKSKLARLIHEQGRGQVGLGFGDVESPNCRGFTQDEFAIIPNFTKIDFSELVSDATKNVSLPDNQKMLEKTGERVDQFFNQFQSNGGK